MEHRVSQGGSLPQGVVTTVRPKFGVESVVFKGQTANRSKRFERRGDSYMWIPTRLMSKFNGNARAALKAYIEEEGNALAGLKGTEEESIKQNDDVILKKGCLDDADVLMAQSALRASCSSSRRSGDAQEEAPFDVKETRLQIKMDNKPEQSCSRDCGNIAHDEDERGHSSKKKTPPAIEDEQHPDKIGVHAVEEHKQEQGSASGHVQALLDMDAETITKKILYFSKCLNSDTPECGDYHLPYDREELIQLFEQLALYRIRAYELTVDRKLAQLSDEYLKQEYPASKLYDKGFFKYYEESLEWCFDPERCTSACFDNYQRLVLHGYCGYLDWDFYSSILNTYEEDLAYVQYFEEVANKTKWIEDYLRDSTIKWERIRSLALMQALEIAADFPNVSPLLVTYGFQEYIDSIKRGYYAKGLDGLYFEIWKRVAKEKMSFNDALREIDNKDIFPSRSFEIKHELENNLGRSPIKDYYYARVADIDIMVPKPKYYLDYARRKLDIADDLN